MKQVKIIIQLRFIIIIAMAVSTSQLLAQPNDLPSDKQATKETVSLYRNLKKVAQKGFLFGHQDDLAYGVNWRYEPGRSDVKEVCGDYPAVYGWDICGLEKMDDKNIDGVPFSNMKEYIEQGYARGGIITIDWHFKSPFDKEKGAWDTTLGTVASALPGGINHEKFKSWLDNGAQFLSSLKGSKGEAIPILFRPFHELSGSWFWWGQNECTPQELIALWTFTKDYLQNKKGLHNLLFVFNTGTEFSTREEYLKRYPGDDKVDILSFDNYQNGDPAKDNGFVTKTNACLAIIDSLGKEKNKPIALAEAGYEQVPYPKWWTETLMNAIGDHKISYVLIWRNHGWNKDMNPPHMHYYAPYPGQISADDFRQFYSLSRTLFEKDANREKMYQ